MSYLIDTDWVADWLVGMQDATEALPLLRRNGVAISTITYMEVVEGILGSRAPQRASRGFRAFLRRIRIIVVSRPIADRAATLRFDVRRQKRPVDHRALDLVVAATALVHGLILVTRNTRDFADIPGVRLYQPK